MNVYVVQSTFAPPAEVFDTPESAANRLAQIPDHLRSRYRMEPVAVRTLGPQETTRMRFAITYRTDEGLFHVGPAGMLHPDEDAPATAKTVLLYHQRAHILLVPIDATSYEDGLWKANNLAALFSMSDSPYGPEWVQVGDAYWKFDRKLGFLNDESPDA